MRKILFRAKRKDNGNWIYGTVVYPRSKKEVYVAIVPIIEGESVHSMIREVIPETVGQFTGLYDKNEQEIFEGDILKITWIYHDRDPESERCFVEFSKGGFFAKLDGRYKAQVANYACAGGGISVKVIGNIHDNPKLLQEA